MARRGRKPKTWLLTPDEIREGDVGWTNPDIALCAITGHDFDVGEEYFSGVKEGTEYFGIPITTKAHVKTKFSRLYAVEDTTKVYRTGKTTIREAAERTGLEKRLIRMTFSGSLVRKQELALRGAEQLIGCYAFIPKEVEFARGRVLVPSMIIDYLHHDKGITPITVEGKYFFTSYQADEIRRVLGMMAEKKGLKMVPNNMGLGGFDVTSAGSETLQTIIKRYD